MKDLGPLRYFLGFQLHYLDSILILNQEKYVFDLLHKLNFDDLKLAPLPSIVEKHLFAIEGTPLFIYRSSAIPYSHMFEYSLYC